MKKLLIGLALTVCGINASASDLELLVVYSDEVRQIYGSRQAADARVRSMVNYTNTAFSNSGINIRAHLVASTELALPNDTETESSTLHQFRQNAELNHLRELFEPDLTVYLTSGSGGWCGWGYFPTSSRAADRGLSIVRHDCGGDTFAHEIGHNLGAGHGRVINNTTGVEELDSGYPIQTARGYGQVNIFRTVMAYWDVYQAPKVQYFSNPDVSECSSSNLQCGVEDYNSADGINTNFYDFVRTYSFNWYESGDKVCEFDDPATGDTVGCTLNTVGGGGPTEAFSVKKDGVHLVHVSKTQSYYSNACTLALSGSSSDYYVQGNCDNFRVYSK